MTLHVHVYIIIIMIMKLEQLLSLTIKKFNGISSAEFTENGHNIDIVVNIVEQC